MGISRGEKAYYKIFYKLCPIKKTLLDRKDWQDDGEIMDDLFLYLPIYDVCLRITIKYCNQF